MNQDDLDPILILSVYYLLKRQASNEPKTIHLSLKVKKARQILIDEMFNIKNNALFTKLLSRMIQEQLIFLDQNRDKIIFKK
ncbi:MAG: hypothetical protein ACTSRC_17310 [Candidatus Helarchaeota archaeon]